MKIRISLICLLSVFIATAAFGAGAEKGTDKIPSDVVQGDFILLFKADELITKFDVATDEMFDAMIEMQTAYLKGHYGFDTVTVYASISKSAGKGMYFVHSDKAAGDKREFARLHYMLTNDEQIESVSFNGMQKLLGVSPSK